jgi:hypothetical protein
MKSLLNVTKTQGLAKELHGIQVQLERIAEMFELVLNQQNMYIAPDDMERDGENETDAIYRDEKQAVIQEMREAMRLRKGGKVTDDTDD